MTLERTTYSVFMFFYTVLPGWSMCLEVLMTKFLQWWSGRRGETKGNENWIQGGGNSSTTDSWCLGGGKSPWNEPLPSAQWGLNNKGRHSLQPDSLLANHRHTWQLHSGARSQYKSFEINPTSCDLKQCAKSSQNWSPKWGGAAFKGDQTTGLGIERD